MLWFCEKTQITVNSIIKTLLPLVKEDGDFLDVAPKLFGPDFKKRDKDNLDQVKWWLCSHLDKLLILRAPTTSQALFSEATLWGEARPGEGVEAPPSKGHIQGRELPVSNQLFLLQKM